MEINESLRELLVEKVLAKLEQTPEVMLEASGRHCHLTREAVDKLFGKDHVLTWVSDLSQPGQFVCKERVKVQGEKGELSNVVVLGPVRSETQLEVSLTDAVSLGIKAPVRLSGKVDNTPGIRLVGPSGELELRQGVIAAKRHIHMTPQDAARFGFSDGQMVSVRVPGERSLTFHHVVLRVHEQFATFMHIDYDEANACGFTKGMMAVILPEE